jgi:urease accessory protein
MPTETDLPRAAVGATVGAVVASLLVAAPAGAHTGEPTNGFVDGALHPVGGLDHVLAMVAVGVLAVLVAGRLPVWSLPAAFVGGMVAGGALGLADVPFPGVEVVIAGSVVVAGLAVAGAAPGRLPVGWLLGAVAIAGAAHGHAHGAEAPGTGSTLLYVLGFVAATFALHVAGAAGGLLVRRAAAVRAVSGAAVAGAGLYLLAA